LEVIYQRPLGYYAVEENECKMQRAEACVFHVKER
jgi:hypothetical protein